MKTRAMRLAGVLAISALFLSATSIVSSFTLLGPDWPSSNAFYRINPNFPATLGGTVDQQIEAIRCGANAWRNQGTANFNFTYVGQTVTTNVNSSDSNNAVFYLNQNSGGPAAATTFTSSVGPSFVGFDMVFWQSNNGGAFFWNGVGDSTGAQTDIIGIAVHEFGHALGLDHTTSPGATMQASFSGTGLPFRTIAPDDIAGVQSIYGANPSLSNDPVINDVQPPDGPLTGGNEVFITGDNFTWTSDTALTINGSPWFNYSVENCSTIRIAAMPGNPAGPVSIGVSNSLGSVTLNSAYFYGSAEPVVTGLTPNAGTTAGGTPITINGSNFTPDVSVSFGLNLLTSLQFVDSQTLTGLTPPGTGSVDVVVAQGSGSDILIDGYSYTDNVLRLESRNVAPGASGVVIQALADHDQPLAGFSFGVDLDSNLITPVEVNLTGTSADGASFFDGQINTGPEPEGWMTVGVVFDLMNVNTIPVGDNDPIANFVIDVSPFAQTGFPLVLEISNTVGVVPIDICFVPPTGVCFSPDTVPGVLQVVEGSLFVRGDGNGDDALDIADAVFVLGYLFSMEPSNCLDALDGNDDGMVNIADAVYLLDTLFTMGPNPPAPFPDPGLDPTPDALDCNF